IMLTGKRTSEDDIVHGLECGADEYLVKPVGSRELLARVQAVLRRARTPSHTEISGSFTFNDGYLVIDISQRSVSAGGRRLKLTPREFQLLALLVGNAGHVLSHRQILEKVWGQEYVDEMDYVRIYVSHLRRKIEPDISRPKYILTEPRVGYYFCTG
ncbi:MAG: response regulator transcription factor, partial [Dehalococcoidales bacterium]|nr:response regulator transcription factor [Dehalococcoidales bacterium]